MKRKMCRTCKKNLLVCKFNRDKSKFDGYQSLCRICNNQYNRIWMAKNKERRLKYSRRYVQNNLEKVRQRHQNRQRILNNLKINGCAICGYNKCPAALDFHHINPKDRKFSIKGTKLNNKDFINELQKTVLLCSNCHRELHWRERHE